MFNISCCHTTSQDYTLVVVGSLRAGRLQALRALGAAPAEEEAAAGASAPSISSFVIASSELSAGSSSPTGGRFFFGASGLSDVLLFGRELGESAAIVELMCPSLTDFAWDSDLTKRESNAIICLGNLMYVPPCVRRGSVR